MGLTLGLAMAIPSLMAIFNVALALVVVGGMTTTELALVIIARCRATTLAFAAPTALLVATTLLVTSVARDAPVVLSSNLRSLSLAG